MKKALDAKQLRPSQGFSLHLGRVHIAYVQVVDFYDEDAPDDFQYAEFGDIVKVRV